LAGDGNQKDDPDDNPEDNQDCTVDEQKRTSKK
jgi:hypothetical protein